MPFDPDNLGWGPAGESPVAGWPLNRAGTTYALILTMNGIDEVVTEDLIGDEPIGGSYGIMGSGPLDLLAGPGTFRFTLDNGPNNSASTRGYYSIGHPDARPGFRHGIEVKFAIDAGGGVYKVIGSGKLETAIPTAGIHSGMVTRCECVDWLGPFLEYGDLQLDLQEDKTDDELIAACVAEFPDAPANVDYDTGLDTFPIAFDDLGGETSMRAVVQRILQSGLSKLALKRNATDGETLCLRNRQASLLASSLDTFDVDDFLVEGGDPIEVPSSRERVFNDPAGAVFPRRVESGGTTIIYSADTPQSVPAGETRKVFVDWRDPDQEAAAIGAKNVQTMAANTDWTANDAEDGSGTDLTANFTVTVTEWGSRALITMVSASGSDGWVRGPGGAAGMQVRGDAIRRYSPIEVRADLTDEAIAESIDRFGRRPIQIDMPYQTDPEVGRSIVSRIANQWSGTGNVPTRVQIILADEDLLRRVLARDVFDHVTVSETQTGVASAKVAINGIEWEIRDNVLRIWWVLAPADPTSAWIFNESKFSEDAFAYA